MQVYRFWMDRNDALRALFDTAGRGLEIGPSYNPLLPKSAGYNVETLDHAPADVLRAKYAQYSWIEPSRIEDVDHVWDGRPLTAVVGSANCFDYVVASHVIEHTPDLLGFLKECDSLLKPDGVLVLAVPDKRRCFDIFRPLSTTGAVLQAHHERRSRHSPAMAFDFAAYQANLDDAIVWVPGSRGNLHLVFGLGTAKELFDLALASSEYQDCHAWTFTPSSFRMIIQDLNGIGALPLREHRFEATPGCEFFVTLGRSGPGCSLARRDLLLRTQEELLEEYGLHSA